MAIRACIGIVIGVTNNRYPAVVAWVRWAGEETLSIGLNASRGDVGEIWIGSCEGLGLIGTGAEGSLVFVFDVDGVGSGDRGKTAGGVGMAAGGGVAVVGGAILRARSCCSSWRRC